jgi:hypothetical protein
MGTATIIGRQWVNLSGGINMERAPFPLLAAIPFIVAGCAWQSEAQKVGPDTYQVSANASPARGGVTGAQQMALANANKKCDSMHKEITVTDIKTEHAFPTNGVATITFTCK